MKKSTLGRLLLFQFTALSLVGCSNDLSRGEALEVLTDYYEREMEPRAVVIVLSGHCVSARYPLETDTEVVGMSSHPYLLRLGQGDGNLGLIDIKTSNLTDLIRRSLMPDFIAQRAGGVVSESDVPIDCRAHVRRLLQENNGFPFALQGLHYYHFESIPTEKGRAAGFQGEAHRLTCFRYVPIEVTGISATSEAIREVTFRYGVEWTPEGKAICEAGSLVENPGEQTAQFLLQRFDDGWRVGELNAH